MVEGKRQGTGLSAVAKWTGGGVSLKLHRRQRGVRRREPCRNQGQLIQSIEVDEMLCGGHKGQGFRSIEAQIFGICSTFISMNSGFTAINQ